MGSEKIKDLDALEGDAPLIVSLGGPIEHDEWVAQTDTHGNTRRWPIRWIGWEIRLYSHRARQRDGEWILTKLGWVTRIEKKMQNMKRKDKKNLKEHATRVAKRIAEEREWIFVEKAKHNDPVPDLFQALLELDEVIARKK